MAITFTLFLLAVLASVMVLNFKSATDFTQRQLYTEAKNTAHSLGLSLSKTTAPNDTVLMESMIDAIFDSGYYEMIRLQDTEGKVIHERITSVQVSRVPAWFIERVPLKSVSASSDITVGWHRFGSLHVKGHTGNAYAQLYQNAQDILKTFFITGGIVLAVLYALLSLSLRSLGRIARQARAIMENAFIIEEKMPFTSEFKDATRAMNAMVSKVQSIFERESETLRRYHELLYVDGQTRLYNRRYVNATLPEYFQADTELCDGGFALVSLGEAAEFKKKHGYQRYNWLMQTFASSLQKEFIACENAIIARLNESDFFVTIPLMSLGDITQHMEIILKNFQAELDKEGVNDVCKVGCSVGAYHAQETIKSLLSRADFGLMHAKNDTNFAIHVCDKEEEDIILGREEWKAELLRSIKDSRIQFAHQGVVCYQGSECQYLHDEIYLRWKDGDGSVYNAGRFVPVAVHLGLIAFLDQHMIQKVLEFMQKDQRSFAINLSGNFFRNQENLEWFKNILLSEPLALRQRLWVEVHNSVALRDLKAASSLATLLKSLGCHFGLDHFTLPDEGTLYLQSLRPEYIKVGCDYLYDALYDTKTGRQHESLTNVITSLGITLVATGLEKPEQVESFIQSGISCFQGRGIEDVETLAT
jgi:EAL domain-containing protein (putative c-di-GMP-specific phosphodiesterase class I)/GGDEF domain-containing protein